MQLPYSQIIVLAFFRVVLTARAAPSGTPGPISLPTAPTGEAGKGVNAGVALNMPSEVKSTVQELHAPRGLPINVMQNNDDSHPDVPIDNYQTDITRLVGGEP
ncbi:hypothetical protein C8Q78DRAFT_1079024 [Trametes maxima]|nr:hypothetical protein C8Q78DRAFT_1079024 [Trametes maxima]